MAAETKFNWGQYLSMLLPLLGCEALWSLGENVYAAIYGRMGTGASAAMTLTNPVQGLVIGALCEEILKTSDFAGEQADITDEKLGENHVYFLPYLMGERSPINDTNARGTFAGMTMDTSRSDMVQAVLEGVAFAIRDSFEVAKSLGIEIPRSNICGGGAKSPLWRKIFANVLGIPLDMVKTEQGPGYGAAMLAMVGCGKFRTVQEAADNLVEVASTTEPDAALTAKYEARYQNFKKLYPALKSFFAATV